MVVPSKPPATLTSVRDELRDQQQKLKDGIDASKTKQRHDEAEQTLIQADVTALDAVIAAQQAGATATGAAITAADDTIRTLEPKIKATLDDQVEKDLYDKFGDLIKSEGALQTAVNNAAAALTKAQGEQTTAQRDLDAKKDVAQQKLAALKALPVEIKALTTDLTRQRTELQTAYDANNVLKAYVLLLELTRLRDRLKVLNDPAKEQALAAEYQTASKDVQDAFTTLAGKQDAVDAAQKALTTARDAQQAFQKDRPRRLQYLWSQKP